MQNTHSDQRIGTKSVIGIGGCLLGLAIIYFGYGVGGESPKKEADAKASPSVEKEIKKPVRSANFALGPMVFFARDLGFSATGIKNETVDSSKIAMRIENQLQNVRDLYRVEIAKNENLAGPITLELDIGSSGEVSEVTETSSRIDDPDFKRDVVDAVRKWSFADLVSNHIKLICPLLFVHEGMDIATLVQWEKSAGNSNEMPLRRGSGAIASNPVQPPAPNSRTATAIAIAKSTSPALKAPPSGASSAQVFQIKYETLLRKEPNFNASALTSFAIGTKVALLKKHGDWLEVRSDNGQTGFIRKEFVTALDLSQK